MNNAPKSSLAAIVGSFVLSAALALSAAAQSSGTAETFRLQAIASPDGQAQFIGYKLAEVDGNGNAPAVLVSEAELDAGSTAFEFTKVAFDDQTFALKIENYPAPAGVDAANSVAYLLSHNDGKMIAQYIPKEKKSGRAQFSSGDSGSEGILLH